MIMIIPSTGKHIDVPADLVDRYKAAGFAEYKPKPEPKPEPEPKQVRTAKK